MNTVVKKIGIGFVMMLLFLPLVQNIYPILEPKPLSGVYEKPEKGILNTDAWFSGDYQTNMNEFIEFNIGFRPWFVKARNQMMYSLFHESTSYVELGKEGYLYTWGYFEAYYGFDYIGEEKAKKISRELRVVQKILKDRGKEFLVVMAPNKARVIPQYLPEKYKDFSPRVSNYDAYLQNFKELGVNHIDFNELFSKWILENDFPLFPKTGIHWSTYGAILAADTIVNKLRGLGGEDLPNVEWVNVELKDTIVSSEDDLERDMNLFFQLDKHKMAYQSLVPLDLKEEQKIPGLVISDSFYWNFYDFDFPQNFMKKDSKFLFYNNTAFDEFQESVPADSLNLREVIELNKYIILMCTGSNYVKFPFGFVEDLKKIMPIEEELVKYEISLRGFTMDSVIAEYKRKILSDDNWKVEISEKAKKQGVSFDDMVDLDARYLADQGYQKELYEKEVDDMIKKIRNAEGWFNDVKRKAGMNGISVEEMLRRDAEYMINESAKSN